MYIYLRVCVNVCVCIYVQLKNEEDLQNCYNNVNATFNIIRQRKRNYRLKENIQKIDLYS